MKIRGYKVFLWITLTGVILMGALAATIVTLAATRSRHIEPQQISIESMISLSPTYGGTNTLVNITGIGFPANSRVSLFLAPAGAEPDSQPHGEALTDDDGRFSVMFPIPAAWRDGTTISDENLSIWAVTPEQDGRAVATFDFIPPVIQPEVAIMPTKGPAGTPITVTSSGFPAGARVQLYLAPPDTRNLTFVVAEGIADTTGSFNVTFNAPEYWPDGSRIKDEQLQIQAIASEQGITALTGFDYVPVPYPLIIVSPNYGGPGTVVKITGDGYPAGVHVLIKVGTSVEDAAQKPAYLETMADTRGLIKLDFTMPGYWPGGLPILVRDVVVLATASDKSGYGWMGFAYLDHAPVQPEAAGIDILEATSVELTYEITGTAPPLENTGVPNEQTQSSGGMVSEETPTPQAPPAIHLLPDSGTVGSSIQVIGSGFQPDTTVRLYLTLPNTEQTSDSYGEVVTDAAGSFITSFALPAVWPDGTPIIDTQLEVVAATQDLVALASTLLTYSPIPPSE